MKNSLLFIFFLITVPICAQWENYSNTNVPEIVSDDIRSIALDENNVLWFGTANGLISYDGQTWARYTKEENNIADNSINQLKFNSEQSSLLLATDNGSNIIDVNSGFSITDTYQTGNSGIYDDIVHSVDMNPDSIKVFGTGKGLSLFNNSIWAPIQNLAAIDSINLAQNTVKSIESTEANTFIASDGKGIYLTTNEVDGLSFVTTWVFPYNIPASDNVKTAFVDSEGNQWYGTDMGAVFHEGLKAQEGSWSDPITTSEGLPDNLVNAIIQDSYGHIWFGTANGAAVKKNDESWSVYSTTDGLISNVIYDILEGPDNRIWFATDKGISKYAPPWASGITAGTDSFFKLSVHPNPSTDGTWIKYYLPSAGPLRLSVYDIRGKLMANIKNEYGTQGEHEVFWNIQTDNGQTIPSGIYFVRIESRNLVSTQKMVILK